MAPGGNRRRSPSTSRPRGPSRPGGRRGSSPTPRRGPCSGATGWPPRCCCPPAARRSAPPLCAPNPADPCSSCSRPAASCPPLPGARLGTDVAGLRSGASARANAALHVGRRGHRARRRPRRGRRVLCFTGEADAAWRGLRPARRHWGASGGVLARAGLPDGPRPRRVRVVWRILSTRWPIRARPAPGADDAGRRLLSVHPDRATTGRGCALRPERAAPAAGPAARVVAELCEREVDAGRPPSSGVPGARRPAGRPGAERVAGCLPKPCDAGSAGLPGVRPAVVISTPAGPHRRRSTGL